MKLAGARLLHVTIFTLNYLYLGRFPTLDELGRKPSCSQEKIISNLRASLAVCGSSNELFSLAPGRSGPELGACLYQLERFFAGCPELQNSYLDKPIGFSENQALFQMRSTLSLLLIEPWMLTVFVLSVKVVGP